MISVTELLGVELPIIQAPMAGVQDCELAIAVSESGGLGSLPCGMLSNSQIEAELDKIKAATSKPINLNFFCHKQVEKDQSRQRAWQQTLVPYFNELGIACDKYAHSNRVPFSHEIADEIEGFSPKVISFHFGLPAPELLARVKGWGTVVLSSATTLAEAKWLEAQGADAIIVQGLEAGGHRGMFLSKDITTQQSLFSLLPEVVAAVDIPVIAAGGIADNKGVKTALSLGASAVQVGTSFLLCNEAKTSNLHKSAILSAQAEHTALTNIFTGKPARGIVNRVMSELGYMSAQAPEFPYAAIELGQLRGKAEAQNNHDFSPLWCGQNTSGCAAISAAEMTLKLAGHL